ncbi:MAG TPA: hypothetical protein ENO20_06960 [Bacteroides sp.]|nr:hypothetical protein [Bacteroides sp.]
MELSSIHHVEPDRLNDFQPDLFITTLGFESRATHIARLMGGLTCRKIALSATENLKEHSFQENRIFFESAGFEIRPIVSGIPDFGSMLSPSGEGNVNILVDCTSMPQLWYFELFRWFSENQEYYATASIRFVYTLAQYVEPGPPQKVKRLVDFAKSEIAAGTKKKKALLLGLGHEESLCESIYRLVRPDLLYLFYADPPVDKQFVEKVFVNNHSLINEVPIRNLIAYPIRNGQVIYQNLVDVILPLRNEYAISLFPQGPKIFSVAAMLIHLSYPDTRISYPVIKKRPVIDRHAIGEPVILDVHFEEEE